MHRKYFLKMHISCCGYKIMSETRFRKLQLFFFLNCYYSISSSTKMSETVAKSDGFQASFYLAEMITRRKTIWREQIMHLAHHWKKR